MRKGMMPKAAFGRGLPGAAGNTRSTVAFHAESYLAAKVFCTCIQAQLHKKRWLKQFQPSLLFDPDQPARFQNDQSSRSASISSVFAAAVSFFILILRAGTPATTLPGSTSLITTAPAATTLS